MSSSRLLVNLGHALIAAAWADGELTEEELTSLKDLLFSIRGLLPSDWEELERRADIPVGRDERERIAESLRNSIANDDHKELVLAALDDLIHADEGFGPAETRALVEIRQLIEKEDRGLISQLTGLFKSPLARRVKTAKKVTRGAARAGELHERIFEEIQSRLDHEGSTAELNEQELRRLSLAGGLLARVAHVDSEIDPGEREIMEQALRRDWDLSAAAARAVVEVALVHGGGNLDYHRAVREFFDLTSEAQRVSFLDICFAVAAVDGSCTHEEMQEIRTISLGLKLSHPQFISAKVKVPQRNRSH